MAASGGRALLLSGWFLEGREGVLSLQGGLRPSGVSGPGQLGPTGAGGLLKVSKMVPRLRNWHEALGDHPVAVWLENSSAAATMGNTLLLVLRSFLAPVTHRAGPWHSTCFPWEQAQWEGVSRPESELRVSQLMVWSGKSLLKESFLMGLT